MMLILRRMQGVFCKVGRTSGKLHHYSRHRHRAMEYTCKSFSTRESYLQKAWELQV